MNRVHSTLPRWRPLPFTIRVTLVEYVAELLVQAAWWTGEELAR